MKAINFILPCILSVLLCCCDIKEIRPTKDRESILHNTDSWIKGTARGDVNDYFNYITSDFVFMGQGKSIKSDSLRSFLTNAYLLYDVSMPNWTTESIEVSDNLAIHQYSGMVYILPKNSSDTLKSDRKYLDVLKKNNKGEWKVHLHAFTINQ